MTADAPRSTAEPAHLAEPPSVNLPAPVSAKRILPWLVAVALFMEALDTTILNTAAPTIASALAVEPLSMKAALTSYMLSLAVFIPISGWIADRFGTRRVFFSAIGIFTLGSALCGLSVNMPMLVCARILQGCGGALMMPVGRISMVRTFPKSELLRAMTFVAMPGLIGPLLGPLTGGLIVAYAHWRLIFFVNVPIGLLGIALTYRFMPDYRSDKQVPLDWFGLLYFGTGVALLSYVLEVFGEHVLPLPLTLVLLVVAVLLLAAYWIHALRFPFPLLQMSLFKVRTFRTAVLGSLITRLGVGGMPFLLPLLYQVGLGYSPVESGMLIMPQPLAAMSLRLFTPTILSWFGYRTVLVVNTLSIGGLILTCTFISPGTPTVLIVLLAFCLGFCSSLQYTSMNTLVFADLTDAEASHGSSIGSTVQQMSMSFGVAIASLLTALFVGGHQQQGSPIMISGIHHTFFMLGMMTMASALIFWQLKPEDGAALSQPPPPQPKKELAQAALTKL